MEKEIEQIKDNTDKPRLLLHACCAPCSTSVIEVLREFFNISLFFYNPNIYPESEFEFRLDELKRLIPAINIPGANVIAPPYNSEEFESIAEGLENLPEGGERCYKCYKLRLERAVSYAKENGFDYVTTTLSVSPYKNAQWLNEIGEELGGKYGINYLYSDFKKGDGYKRSCELSEKFGLYRQNYCGCIYSKRERED